MMKALKNFKAVYVSPIQLRYGGELVKIIEENKKLAVTGLNLGLLA